MNTSALRRLEHPKSKSIPPLYDLQYVSQPSYSVDSTINMHTTPVEKNVGVSENGEKTGYFIGIMMTDQWISGHPPETAIAEYPGDTNLGFRDRGCERSFRPENNVGDGRGKPSPPRHKCFIGSSFLPMVNPKKWRFPKIGVPRVPPNHPCWSDFPSYISHFGVLMETPKWLSFQGLLDSISAGYLSAGVKSLNGDLKMGCIQGLKWPFHARSDILFREKMHSRWFYKLDAEVWLRALVGLQVELA